MRLIEAFPIKLPSGTEATGRLYQSPHRDSGRRIIVDVGGQTVYDTDYAYDLGNALNSLNQWLESQPKGAC